MLAFKDIWILSPNVILISTTEENSRISADFHIVNYFLKKQRNVAFGFSAFLSSLSHSWAWTTLFLWISPSLQLRFISELFSWLLDEKELNQIGMERNSGLEQIPQAQRPREYCVAPVWKMCVNA